jgi:hypothetical protein
VTALPLYSRTRPCAKCGEGGSHDVYQFKLDRIRRQCANCGHLWLERPLDKAQAGELPVPGAGNYRPLAAGDRWFCARKRAGYDEIVEVKSLPQVLP